MKNIRTSIAFIVILALAVFLRFYQLGNSGNGFYLDEAAIGYNAYSIMLTGRDEFGKSFPLLFRSFTDFKAPLYIYLSIIPIKILGLSVFSTRFISAFSGLAAVFICYFFINMITKGNRLLSLLTTLTLAIAPWHVFYSRGAWESNLSLLLLMVGSYFCYRGFLTKKRGIFFVGSIFFVLSTYAYHGQRIVAPLILGTYILYFRNWLLENKKLLIQSFAALAIIALPILIISFTPGGQSRVKSLNYFSSQSILPWQNSNSLIKNHTLLATRKWFALYTAYYSPKNLFSPDPAEKQRWLIDLATFYSWQFPLFIIGITFLVRNKKYSELKYAIIPWLLFSPVAAAFTGDPFSTVRALPLVFPLCVIIAIGICEVYLIINQKLGIVLSTFSIILLTSISVINLLTQLIYILPYQRAKFWEIGYQQTVNELLKYPNKKIVIDNSRAESYIHVLFFTKFDPATYQKEAGFLELPNYYYSYDRQNYKKFGQFEYRGVDWGKEEKEGNIIVGDELMASKESIITNPRRQLLKEILFPDKTVAFRIIRAF